MKLASKLILTAALAGIVTFADHGTPLAADAPRFVTLKPMTGPSAPVKGQHVFLNVRVGSKQAVSYFLKQNGRCKLTVMVGDAYNGISAPNLPAVRFEVAIGPDKTARMYTAEGKFLEFACQGRAEELNVRQGAQPIVYPPGT